MSARVAPVAATASARVVGHFLAPREGSPPVEPAVAVTQFAARAAVLGSPADAPPLAAALANALRASHRDRAAVVAIWAPGERASSAPATPSAARLAARLTARGLPISGRGRLAWLPLPDDPVATARRAAGALEVPLVVAVARPRTDALEEILDDQDLIVVVTRDPAGALARAALAGCSVPAVACPPLGACPRRLALAGLAGARALPGPVRVAIRELDAPARPADREPASPARRADREPTAPSRRAARELGAPARSVDGWER